MKEILAIIRPEMLTRTEAGLIRSGALGFTYTSAEGRGKQKGKVGLRHSEGEIRTVHTEGFVPKVILSVIVEDDRLQNVMKAIINVNYSNRAGDGKIFVCPITDCIRIRTGEVGESAIR